MALVTLSIDEPLHTPTAKRASSFRADVRMRRTGNGSQQVDSCQSDECVWNGSLGNLSAETCLSGYPQSLPLEQSKGVPKKRPLSVVSKSMPTFRTVAPSRPAHIAPNRASNASQISPPVSVPLNRSMATVPVGEVTLISVSHWPPMPSIPAKTSPRDNAAPPAPARRAGQRGRNRAGF